MSICPRDDLEPAEDARWLAREQRLFAARAELVDDEPLPALDLRDLRAVEARAGGPVRERGGSVAHRAGWAGAGLAAAALLGVLANSGSPRPPAEARSAESSAPSKASARTADAYDDEVCLADDDSSVMSSSKADPLEGSDAASEASACSIEAAHTVLEPAPERTCSEEIDAPLCGSL